MTDTSSDKGKQCPLTDKDSWVPERKCQVSQGHSQARDLNP